MSLRYYYAFSAPGTTTAAELEVFLQSVAVEARAMGFDYVSVRNVVFDTPKKLEAARLLASGARLQSPKLKGVVLLREGQVLVHDNENGSCGLMPERAVFLFVRAGEEEAVGFGFVQLPAVLVDLNGKEVLKTLFGDRWVLESSVNSPDERYRKIVRRFADAGYLDLEKDEFAESKR